jgi:hypothetical protein
MSDSDDDWETAEIPEGAFQRVDVAAIEAAEREARDRAAAEALARDRAAEEAVACQEASRLEREKKKALDERPVLIVDLTSLDPEVHNRADKHAVSDVAKASALRRKIEASYDTYANDASMKDAGTVRGSTRGKYTSELSELRDAHPGHYFCAAFPS